MDVHHWSYTYHVHQWMYTIGRTPTMHTFNVDMLYVHMRCTPIGLIQKVDSKHYTVTEVDSKHYIKIWRAVIVSSIQKMLRIVWLFIAPSNNIIPLTH